jgi:type II secretion system protein G
MKRRIGFTLIELLIVVAIIAILAAIAVPNFLEAQVRSKVSRGKSDMRSMSVALEAYRIDSNAYPYGDFGTFGTRQLTTPVSYMTSLPQDPFMPNKPWHAYSPYYFFFSAQPSGSSSDPAVAAWPGFVRDYRINIGEISDPGDTTLKDISARWQIRTLGPDKEGDWGLPYDATNGTTSRGDIVLFGPGNCGRGF